MFVVVTLRILFIKSGFNQPQHDDVQTVASRRSTEE